MSDTGIDSDCTRYVTDNGIYCQYSQRFLSKLGYCRIIVFDNNIVDVQMISFS